MDNSTRPPTKALPPNLTKTALFAELAELKQMLRNQNGIVVLLQREGSKQGRVVRELREELALNTVEAARGDQLYDTKELAERWQVSERTVETEVAEGNLVPTFIRGARRFTPDAVQAYERTNSGLRRRRGARRRAATKPSS